MTEMNLVESRSFKNGLVSLHYQPTRKTALNRRQRQYSA
jgi:hypothetical protein